jgi:hypothetical protein
MAIVVIPTFNSSVAAGDRMKTNADKFSKRLTRRTPSVDEQDRWRAL